MRRHLHSGARRQGRLHRDRLVQPGGSRREAASSRAALAASTRRASSARMDRGIGCMSASCFARAPRCIRTRAMRSANAGSPRSIRLPPPTASAAEQVIDTRLDKIQLGANSRCCASSTSSSVRVPTSRPSVVASSALRAETRACSMRGDARDAGLHGKVGVLRFQARVALRGRKLLFGLARLAMDSRSCESIPPPANSGTLSCRPPIAVRSPLGATSGDRPPHCPLRRGWPPGRGSDAEAVLLDFGAGDLESDCLIRTRLVVLALHLPGEQVRRLGQAGPKPAPAATAAPAPSRASRGNCAAQFERRSAPTPRGSRRRPAAPALRAGR